MIEGSEGAFTNKAVRVQLWTISGLILAAAIGTAVMAWVFTRGLTVQYGGGLATIWVIALWVIGWSVFIDLRELRGLLDIKLAPGGIWIAQSIRDGLKGQLQFLPVSDVVHVDLRWLPPRGSRVSRPTLLRVEFRTKGGRLYSTGNRPEAELVTLVHGLVERWPRDFADVAKAAGLPLETIRRASDAPGVGRS